MALSEAAGFIHRDLSLSNGVTIHVVERSGRGTPVILLHGIWGSWESWLPVLDLPVDTFDGRPLFLFDLRGHGASGKPSTGYGLADYADDLRAFIDQLTDEQVILVGHSLGALTCLAAAMLVPRRIETMVLEEPPFPIPTNVRTLDGFWAEFAEAVVGLLFLKHQPTEVIVEQLMERDPELTRTKAEDAANSITTCADGVFASIINGEFNVDCLTHSELLEHIPVLIFQGALPDHRALSDQGVLELRELMPQARVEILPETGHSVHQVDPEGFSRTVRMFLRSRPAH